MLNIIRKDLGPCTDTWKFRTCSNLQIEPRALFWCVCYDGNNLALGVNYQGRCVVTECLYQVLTFDCNRTVGNHPQCGQRVQTFRVLLHGADRTRTGRAKENSCLCTRSAEISRSSESHLWGVSWGPEGRSGWEIGQNKRVMDEKLLYHEWNLSFGNARQNEDWEYLLYLSTKKLWPTIWGHI